MKKILIKLEKVTKTFSSFPPLLKDISLVIEKGEIFGIIGLSGAGKSTLLRILSLLSPPSEGTVCFEDKLIQNWDWKSLKPYHSQCGFIFQHYNLLESRNAFENIAYPLQIRGISKNEIKRKVIDLLTLVELKDKAHVYPSRLSGGEKQRVAIARALITNPKVLFSDEATSALDPKTTRSILELLRKINREHGITIVLITHEMDVIKQICNRVAVLDRGAIVEMGSLIDLLSKPLHPTTQYFLQHSSHEIPLELFSQNREKKLVRLSFRGALAKEPILSELILKHQLMVNILLGSIDKVLNETVGYLIVEFTGSEEKLKSALEFLEEKGVDHEVLLQ